LILALAVGIVGVFGAVVWNAYSQGVRSADEAATPQLSSSGPFKTRLQVEPGSDQSDAQVEASVFERVEAAPSRAPAVAFPAEEVTPTTPEVRAEAPVAAISLPEAPAISDPAQPPQQKAALPPVVEPLAVAPAAPLDGAYRPAFSPGGSFVVQLAAPSTEAAAETEWDRRVKSMPDHFSGAEKFVERAEVNGRTVFRLRAGPFANAADADGFCGAIKAKGGDCYRTRK